MALTFMSYTDNSTVVDVQWEGGLTTAHVLHTLTGITARAHAKHNPEDTYSQVYGSDLAIARAKARLYNKIQKRLVTNPSIIIEGDLTQP